jgi:hypothetical protein
VSKAALFNGLTGWDPRSKGSTGFENFARAFSREVPSGTHGGRFFCRILLFLGNDRVHRDLRSSARIHRHQWCGGATWTLWAEQRQTWTVNLLNCLNQNKFRFFDRPNWPKHRVHHT